MKVNKIMLATLLAMGMSAGVQAADQGHGKVTFTGAIIDSPCSIAPESVDQTVELGQISNAALMADGGAGTSIPRNFEIKLENCSFDQGEPMAVTTTFTGAAGVDGKLGITGNAKGAGIVLTDGAGNKIKLGEKSAAQTLQENSNTLLFSAYLQGDGASSTVVAGDFTGVADFMLEYE